MLNIDFRVLSPDPTKPSLLLLAFIIFCVTMTTAAQMKVVDDDLPFLQSRHHFSDVLRRHLPPESPALGGDGGERPALAADGNLDPNFNVSVTEGFGFISESVVQPDGKLIVVGQFQRVNGTRRNNIARYNADGTLDTSFNPGDGASATIRAVALQPDGKILVGGDFTTFNNVQTRRIARLNADGSLDPTFDLSVNFNNSIRDIALQPDGKILVGGSFTLFSSRFVRLNTNGTIETAFADFSSVIFQIVYTPGNKILVAGDRGFPNRAVRRVNLDGTPDASFNPGAGPDSTATKLMLLPDGKILLGGMFRNFNQTPTDALVRLNENGSLDQAFNFVSQSGAPDYLETTAIGAQPDGKILVGYYYERSEFATRVVRLETNGTVDPTFAPGDADASLVSELSLTNDGKILVTGGFVSYNDQTRLRLMKLDANGTIDNAFNPAVSTLGIVYAIEKQPDGKTIIAGDFDFVNGVRRGGLARLSADGSLDGSFNVGEGFLGDVFGIALQNDGKVVAAGGFYAYNQTPTFFAVRLNSDGSYQQNLYPFEASLFISRFYAVDIQPNGQILLAGIIRDTSFNSVPALRINSNGALDTTFNPPVMPAQSGGTIFAVKALPDGKVLIGGSFFATPEFPRTGVARLNINGSLDTTLASGFNTTYDFDQAPSGEIYAAGSTLTRFTVFGAIDQTFNLGSGPNSTIRTVDLQADGKILIGGFFTAFNGTPVTRLARINPNGTVDTSFQAAAGGTVFALQVEPSGGVLAGGQFDVFNGTQRFSLARLLPAAVRRTRFDFDGDGKTDVSVFRPAGGEWWIQRSSDLQTAALQFGASSDRPVPADYTGDGKTDVAFWRPATGEWFILRSENGTFYSFPFGTSGDVPVTADFDGDGKADTGVFRPSNSTWYIQKSAGGTDIIAFGAAGDVPVAADYDGDNRADIGIFRPNGTNGAEWWINRSTAGLIALQFGAPTDKAVAADYTGDGRADVAVFAPASGLWYVLRSEDFSYYAAPFGAGGDLPVPGDYDGDGKTDLAVFRPSSATWFAQRSTAGTLITGFGANGDLPLPN